MKNRRTLDYDGLDGILQPANLVKSKTVWYKSTWTYALVSALLVSLFLYQYPSQTPSSSAINTDQARSTDSISSNQVNLIATAPSSGNSPIPQPETLAESVSKPPLPQIETSDARVTPNTEPASESPENDMPIKSSSETLFTAYFKFSSRKPRLLTTTETNKLVSAAKSCPNMIKLTGHTCNLGSDAGNQKLGMARAEALRKLLISHGIPMQRIVTSSEGMNKPVATNDTKPGQALNRRTELSCLDN